ncbi:hypothetical protein Angca_004844 [Angiostrongylus cantonensis]|nr:hypothetical protein Angca_004844 [Angiostrongylus cantonensis]
MSLPLDASNFSAEDFAKWFRDSRPNAVENNVWRWEPIARGFGISYVILGSLAISLNLFFLYSLLAKRRKSFFHTFYIMILDFTIIDTIKGISSILFAIKLLKTDLNSDQSIISIRVDQYSGLLLRFANLATILNLLCITLNEYVFICYPLRYSDLITRKRVVLVIVCIWIISSVATFAKMIVGLQNRNIWIDDECDKDANWMSSCVHRLQTSSSSQFIYHLGLVVFCLLCLAVTAYSYSILFRSKFILINHELCPIHSGDRRFENRHVLKRHKYVVVIGTVIGIYSVYLTAYATIQVLMLVNISELSNDYRRLDLLYLKYICYLFISLHSLLQPLCYLRIREFRTLIKKTLCSKEDHDQFTNNDAHTMSLTQKDINGGNNLA